MFHYRLAFISTFKTCTERETQMIYITFFPILQVFATEAAKLPDTDDR